MSDEPMPRKVYKPQTMVYVAKRQDGLRKVGCTQNISLRIKSLRQIYGMDLEVETIWHVENAMAVEQLAHALLRPFLSKRVRGREIYRASLRRVAECVKKAMVYAEAGQFFHLKRRGWYDFDSPHLPIYRRTSNEMLRARLKEAMSK